MQLGAICFGGHLLLSKLLSRRRSSAWPHEEFGKHLIVYFGGVFCRERALLSKLGAMQEETGSKNVEGPCSGSFRHRNTAFADASVPPGKRFISCPPSAWHIFLLEFSVCWWLSPFFFIFHRHTEAFIERNFETQQLG